MWELRLVPGDEAERPHEDGPTTPTAPRRQSRCVLTTSARPFVYIEGRYEFEGNWTDQCVRSQA